MRILIVDDEFPAREILKIFIKEIAEADAIFECADGQDAIDFLEKQSVDLVLLDIHMGEKDGFAVAEKINLRKNPPLIVFTTGYSEYALKAFENKAVDYIMKPYSKERLKQTFEHIVKLGEFSCISGKLHNRYIEKGKILVWSNDRLVVIDLDDVLYAKPHSKGKISLVTRERSYEYRGKLEDLEDCFKTNRFLRVHKSFVVNLEAIGEIIPWFNSTYMLALKDYDGEKVPVSRHYIQAFKKTTGLDD